MQEIYPPDLESTGLWVSACKLSNIPFKLDLEHLTSFLRSDGTLATWISREDQPVDYTSQLIMWLSYRCAGINLESVLDAIIKLKMSSYENLIKLDVFYGNPLLFIYFSLFIPDSVTLPDGYKNCVSRFLVDYLPVSNLEKTLIKIICERLGLHINCNDDKVYMHEDSVLFTNGKRKQIKYSSSIVSDVLKSSKSDPNYFFGV